MLEKNETNKNEDIYLIDIFLVIWEKKIIVFTTTAIAAVLSVFIALQLPNIYSSNSILAPADPQDSLSTNISALSPLSAIAGLPVPDIKISKTAEGVERIKSFEFFSKHFLPNINLENLFAAKGWDIKNNTIIYDKKLYDSQNKEWVRKVKFPKKKKPSAQEAYKVYKRILQVNLDKKTSFITISIEHFSPNISKKWLDLIIHQINESMRELDREFAQRSIDFLNEAQQSSNVQSMKEVTSLLLEQQMQTLMLVSANKDYIYNIIEPPIAPERKSKPNRAMLCIIGTFLGGVLSLMIVFIQHLREK